MKKIIMEFVKEMQDNQLECLAISKRSTVRGAVRCYMASEGADMDFCKVVLDAVEADMERKFDF